MAACNSDNHRWGNWREDRDEALATNRHQPRGKVTILNCDHRSAEERQAEHSLATGTSGKLWK